MAGHTVSVKRRASIDREHPPKASHDDVDAAPEEGLAVSHAFMSRRPFRSAWH